MTAVEEQGFGCRTAFVAVALLVVDAAVLFGVGLWLIASEGCAGLCETVGLTLLYAGGPVSALFGVATGAVVVAWPLDLIFWITLGFVFARADRIRRAVTLAVAAEMAALVYGLLLSFLVVRA